MLDKNELPIWEQQMFHLMDMLMFSKRIESPGQFLQSIGAVLPTAALGVEAKPLFGHEQFYKASKMYGVSMDWFYGFTEIMRRRSTKDDPLLMIKDALTLLEKQAKPK